MPKTLQNPYEALGVDRTASSDEIKLAYRRLALKYHPDRNPGDVAAEERFKEISEAYATLRDPTSRARFDRYGGTRPEAGRPDFNTVDWQTVFQEADINIDWSTRGAGFPRTGNAVFDALFGVVTGMMRNSGLLPGEDRETTVELPLSAARTGAQRTVRIPGPSVCAQCEGRGVYGSGPCPACGGRGALRGGSDVEVKIPRNVKDGLKLRLRGLGGPGRPPGDAYVNVRVRVPAHATLLGRDLKTELALTPSEARRGTTLEVLGVEVQVPKGSRDGQVLRVAGGGLGGGQLVVTLRVDTWRGLGRRLRDIFQDAVKGA